MEPREIAALLKQIRTQGIWDYLSESPESSDQRLWDEYEAALTALEDLTEDLYSSRYLAETDF
jgi:hypothetical protein